MSGCTNRVPEGSLSAATDRMNPSAYIETSVVSYLTARPSRDMVVAAYQEVTREWWQGAADRFRLVASELVLAECGAGDVNAARTRLQALQGISILRTSRDAESLTRLLLDGGAIPHEAAADAAHIAMAVVNGVEYLVTWNFRHIANATMRARIEHICRQSGFEPPTICTPNELTETGHEDHTD